MNKWQAMRTISDTKVAITLCEKTDEGCISYTSPHSSSLCSVRIFGGMTDEVTIDGGVGIIRGDECVIKLRIHGETYLDGYEFERILKERNSPCYGGQYDDEHFIYVAKANNGYTLLDRTDMYMPNGNLSVVGDALLFAPITSGSKATGMQIKAINGNRAISFLGTEGAVEFQGNNGNASYNYALIHRPLASEFSYAIRYDTMRILQNGNMTSEPYSGYIKEVTISSPLYKMSSSFYGELYDEYDVLSGVIKRRVQCYEIKEEDIESAYYMDYPVYMVKLPSMAKTDFGVINGALYESEYFLESPGSMLLDMDGETLYLNLADDCASESEVMDYLSGYELFMYALYEEMIENVEIPELSTEAGTVAIEVCSTTPAPINITYIA